MKLTDVTRVLRRCSEDAGCWVYGGALNTDGYARVKVSGRMVMAHRLTWVVLRAELPTGLQIDHLCRRRACVNPWHMEAVTPKENKRRIVVPTHCPHGHEYTEENTYRTTRGARYCRTCHLQRCKERRAK